MVDVAVKGRVLHLELQGWDKLWAFKGGFEIPLEHVQSASVVPGMTGLKELVQHLGVPIRAPGTAVPGLIFAGSYYFLRGGWVFLDVHRPFNRMILIDLADEGYRKLVVDVQDPEAAVRLIQNAVSSPKTV